MADKRKNRVFVTERRDIVYPMWRKKVDASIFIDKAILIPKFAESWWKISKYFKGVHSIKNKASDVTIEFEGKEFVAHVTELNAKKRKDSYRLFYGSDLADLLKGRFLMTYMRDLEFKMGDYDDNPKKRVSIEDVIPFNEFLDVEFYNKNKKRRFIFTAHYTQQPTFPNLFKKILDTTVLKSISLEIEGKFDPKVLKSKWFKKSDLKGLPDQPNVVYMLYDEINSEIYVGEAKSLKTRLSQNRPEIKHWTHFRYNVLPMELEPYRVVIERMVIRDFASVFPNRKGVKSFKLSESELKNLKIDL